ncbi:hypothetical protein EJ02DRAFT_420781 [Clathrospora elynae]|uniref:Xylanolytic transcriptional activator regulatory domain-containing protein n=1 Tax=Clathrospora elynae TaxID=706981 RepID=A0A6A5T4I2_9PLEO|nr:hypothetical protein EJ02DRAFT_420781 [Clathrospora elynae]
MTDLDRSFWHAMNRRAQDSDYNDSSDEHGVDNDFPPPVLRKGEIVKAWDQLFNNDLHTSDHLLFCSRNTGVDLSALHPNQAQIFKLWQIYLENVDPLLKITHTPTLQARIIDAASDVRRISPTLEALMFSIYCMAVFSLNQDECLIMFGTPREDIIRRYQLGAKEALLNCGFLKTSDRDCLTALHLYLISLKPDIDPRSLSSILGATMRIAQRMGIDTESVNAKHPVLEAELRRRLWWSLVLFETRISEMTEFKTAMLIPTWDCKVPLNVNDFYLRAEMKNVPKVHGQPSEVLFVVMRSEIGDFVRHLYSHLDFINPILKSLGSRAPYDPDTESIQLGALEAMIEGNLLRSCDPDNPLHYMTMWTARFALAKSRFVHHLATCSPTNEQQTDAQRDAGLTYARSMLEYDTKLMSSSLIRGFRWIIYPHFPFPAYVHLIHDLRKRPLGDHVEKFWQVISDNCAARFMDLEREDKPMEKKPGSNHFFKIFSSFVLEAWAAREAAFGQSEEPPLMVKQIKQKLALADERSQAEAAALENANPVSDSNQFHPPEPMDFGNFGAMYGMAGDLLTDASGATQAPLGFSANQWGWPAPNWNSISGQGW